MSKSGSHSEPRASAWIYNPWLDLIVGCGAWSAPLLLVSYSTMTSSTRAWSVLFYALALFVNYPHYMATIYRAYRRPQDFEKYRIFTVHATALIVLTLVISHYWTALVPWLFTIFVTWSPWRYSGQNYGLFMTFARRAGGDPDQGTRQALYGAFVVSYLILLLGFHTGPSHAPLFRSLGIPAAVSGREELILGACFVVLSVYGLVRLARQTGWRKLLPSLTVYSSQLLWFLLPTTISLFDRIDIPQTRYATGVMAVMHSAQYLWITSYYARREAAGDAKSTGRGWRPLAYFAVLMVGGIALFVPRPWLASRTLHRDFSTSFLIFTSLVNIHHFILDGAIWKLRDGRIAALLLTARDRVTNARNEAGGSLAPPWRWMTGNSVVALRFRVSMAVLILAWGTVDQARHYLALDSEDLNDLKRAAALNGFDGPLQARLARKELEIGNAQEAEAARRRAIQANPFDPGPRQGLLKFLLEQKRLDEAFLLSETSLKYVTRDANLLVNHGLLALGRGQANEALSNWDQALKIDPSQSLPHLYLAHELNREGRARQGAEHYWNYLETIGRQPEQRPSPDVLIGVVLRMADCQSRSSQPDAALKSYQMAVKLAQQAAEPKLESIANVNAAPLQAQAGKINEALRLYRLALDLDEGTGDKAAAAVDWFVYGQFLEQSGFPARIAYACMVRSELIGQSLSTPVVPSRRKILRLELEKKLGAEAAAIRRNPEPALRDAVAAGR